MSKEEDNLFMQVIAERNAKYNLFELLINDQQEFALFFLTTSNEELIEFYNYLRKTQKSLEFEQSMGSENPKLAKVSYLVSTLEQSETIRTYLEEEKQRQIDETVALIEERQKVKKMGSIRRLIHNSRKK